MRLARFQLGLSFSSFFFFNDTATTEIYTLSLHDALPLARDLGPATDRDARPPPVHGDDHPCRPSPADLAEELRIQRGSRPHDGPARAGLERQPDRLEIAQAATHLHGDWGRSEEAHV